jgi:hypothetical protein
VVSDREPHPAVLLSYLFLLQLGVLWLERQRGLVVPAGDRPMPAVLAGPSFVIAFTQAADVSAIDAVAVPVYLIAVAASVFWLSPRWSGATDWPESRIVGLASAVASAVLMLLWLADGDFQAGDWAFAILLAAVGR